MSSEKVPNPLHFVIDRSADELHVEQGFGRRTGACNELLDLSPLVATRWLGVREPSKIVVDGGYDGVREDLAYYLEGELGRHLSWSC